MNMNKHKYELLYTSQTYRKKQNAMKVDHIDNTDRTFSQAILNDDTKVKM